MTTKTKPAKKKKKEATLKYTPQQANKAVQALKWYIEGDVELTEEQAVAYRDIVRDYSKKNFFWFCEEVLGYSALTKQNKQWCDKFQSEIFGFKRFLRMHPRGTHKTTIYGVGLILWIWATISREIRVFYTSANKSLLEEVSEELDVYLAEEGEQSLYSQIFDVRRHKKWKQTWDVFNITGRATGKGQKGFSLVLKTIGTKVTGTHPHFVIADDICDIEDRESTTEREKKKRWLQTIYPLLRGYRTSTGHEIKTVLIVGTFWHFQDTHAHIVERTKKALGEPYNIQIEGVRDADKKRIHKEIYTNDDLKKLKDDMGDILYACQIENNPLPEGAQVFDKAKMHWIPQRATIREQSGQWTFEGVNYVFFDPAEGTEEGDYPAVWFVNWNGKKLHFFDAIDEKMALADLIPVIIGRAIKYRCEALVYEKQSVDMIKAAFETGFDKVDYSIWIQEVPAPRINKNARIISAQPYMYSGNVYFNLEWKRDPPECIKQIVLYPAYGPRDFPDCAEIAIRLLIGGDAGGLFRFYEEKVEEMERKRVKIELPHQFSEPRQEHVMGTKEMNQLKTLMDCKTVEELSARAKVLVYDNQHHQEFLKVLRHRVKRAAEIKGFSMDKLKRDI